jgi:hypothetical protein
MEDWLEFRRFLRNFVPVPYLPRLELCCLNVEPRQ